MTHLRNIGMALSVVALATVFLPSCSYIRKSKDPLRHVTTVAGMKGEFGETFGIAVRNNSVYISDGEKGEVARITPNRENQVEGGLDTPSGVAFLKGGIPLVVDSGRHTIYKLDPSPTSVAGNGTRGFQDGPAHEARFNGPIGIASRESEEKIYIADTYNDRIRVIENGNVRTLAGSTPGFQNGDPAMFDTPTGIAVWQDKLLVTDTGNRRIRVVEADGRVWTLAGNGESNLRDGSLLSASFVAPTAIAVDPNGVIYIADGNAIREISGPIPMVRTVAGLERGLADGEGLRARFNRPTGLAFDDNGDLLIADSENRVIRKLTSDANPTKITPEQIAALDDKPDEFRKAAPARWPFDPPTAKRDIAGTLGEIRGKMTPAADNVWFHNGLDIAGSYGETARFIRSEKVLKPIAAENFGTLRELIRMPTLGYIHIRLGRDKDGKLFDDPRFQFQRDPTGKLTNVRVPRGTRFEAGEPIGTLNPMNHVHLIAGRSGSEMNALAALELPGIADSRPPVIEILTLFDQNWKPIETPAAGSRIRLSDKTRVVVKAYDQVDGNNERRRLGVYSVSLQINGGNTSEIRFDRMPSNLLVSMVYANESHSGATGETIFNYIATNSLVDERAREGFIDPSKLDAGVYIATIVVADYFGNRASKQFEFEVTK